MDEVGEHVVPAGPLAVRWRAYELPPIRAGAVTFVRVALENAGLAPWRPQRGLVGIKLAYHWLDDRGNAIVWDGFRTDLPHPVAPGERVEADVEVRGPIPPGRYRLAFDLVDDGRLWLSELGNAMLERDVTVERRVGRALAVVGGDEAALSEQEEELAPLAEAHAVAFLGDGVAPPPEWSRRVLDLHEDGWAIVGAAIDARRGLGGRAPAELEPWAPGRGRVRDFPHPVVCPSIVREIEPQWVDPVAGLPAARPPEWEPALFEGQLVLRARLRSGRRRG